VAALDARTVGIKVAMMREKPEMAALRDRKGQAVSVSENSVCKRDVTNSGVPPPQNP
jgi:hypothetical protein